MLWWALSITGTDLEPSAPKESISVQAQISSRHSRSHFLCSIRTNLPSATKVSLL